MSNSAVVSYHTNPYTCGVARFNQSLSDAMRLPLVRLDDYLQSGCEGYAVLSLKLEEIDEGTQKRLADAVRRRVPMFDVFLHGVSGTDLEQSLCISAKRVFAASREIAGLVASVRPDVISVFAPGAPVVPAQEPVDCTMLTFGMAHKIRSEGYRMLASILASDERSFRLEISTALHEGGTFNENFFTVGKEISQAFVGNVRFLGFLADAEVSERLRSIDVLVAFFPRGVRENNTTVLSAMSHGCPVLTNLDADSPPWMVHGSTVFDIGAMARFPDKSDLRRVGDAGRTVASEYNFERLASLLASRK